MGAVRRRQLGRARAGGEVAAHVLRPRSPLPEGPDPPLRAARRVMGRRAGSPAGELRALPQDRGRPRARPRSTSRAARARSPSALWNQIDADTLVDRGVLVAGDPESCLRSIAIHEEAGVDELQFLMATETVPHDKVMSSIEMFGKHVIPELKKTPTGSEPRMARGRVLLPCRRVHVGPRRVRRECLSPRGHHGARLVGLAGLRGITVFYLTAALVLPAVGAAIDRHGSHPVIAGGAVLLALGVAAMGYVAAPGQLYAAFVCMGLGYATMSVIGLSATIAPWFEKYQGRAVAMALTGASVGAMVVVPLVTLSIARHGFPATTTGAAAIAASPSCPSPSWCCATAALPSSASDETGRRQLRREPAQRPRRRRRGLAPGMRIARPLERGGRLRARADRPGQLSSPTRSSSPSRCWARPGPPGWWA